MDIFRKNQTLINQNNKTWRMNIQINHIMIKFKTNKKVNKKSYLNCLIVKIIKNIKIVLQKKNIKKIIVKIKIKIIIKRK